MIYRKYLHEFLYFISVYREKIDNLIESENRTYHVQNVILFNSRFNCICKFNNVSLISGTMIE